VGCRGTQRLPAGLVAALVLVACRAGSDGSHPTDATATSTTRTTDRAGAANATVEYVVDGDTIDVAIDGDDERVRLIGIDTPETRLPDSGVECFGPEASAFTAELLPPGTPVRLERDVVGRDDYGRLLAYVYRAGDGVFVNYEIVRQGFAQPLTIPPNVAHADLFVEAARAAEAADAGLWGRCRD
jgi:micrococcal nuclease